MPLALDALLFANKAILSEASPIIKAFLAIEPDGPFLIDEDDEQSIVTSADVVDLLKFIYPQFSVKLTEHNSKRRGWTGSIHTRPVLIPLVTGLIHLAEKFLVETLRNECKRYVHAWLRDLEMTSLDEKKDIVPRHILYKDGTRKHIASEIGTDSRDSENAHRAIAGTLCAWFREYASRDENLTAAILNVLKHASTDDLERNEIFAQMTDREKTAIYKMISEYLEQNHPDASLMFASGDARMSNSND